MFTEQRSQASRRSRSVSLRARSRAGRFSVYVFLLAGQDFRPSNSLSALRAAHAGRTPRAFPRTLGNLSTGSAFQRSNRRSPTSATTALFARSLWQKRGGAERVVASGSPKHCPACYPNKYLRPCSSRSSRSFTFSLSAYILTSGSVPDGRISIQALFSNRNFTPSMRFIFSTSPPADLGRLLCKLFFQLCRHFARQI